MLRCEADLAGDFAVADFYRDLSVQYWRALQVALNGAN
jgi:hypothetical protein